MKKILTATMIVLSGLLLVSNAFAASVTFSLDGLWDWSTKYSYNAGTNTWVSSGVNPYYGTTSQSLVNNTVTAGDNKEDMYGIARVNYIVDNDSGATLYDRSTASSELTVFYYGFDDIYLNGTMSSTRILGQGGHALLYQDFTPDYNPGVPPSAGSRGGVAAFPKITDGNLVLDLTPHSLLDGDTGASYTFENTFNFNSYSGSGSVLFDVTGGAWQSLYDTNGMNFGSDIAFNFSSFPAVTNNPGSYNSLGWLVKGTGNADGNVVPEPATMILLGIGTCGLAALRRKKVA